MHGAAQGGITNRPPDHALFAAFEAVTADPAATAAAVERLRGVLRAELTSDLAETTPASPKDQPSAETGELGFCDGFDRYHLTITVGFAKSLFDKLGVSADEQPQDLRSIDWVALGDQADDGTRTVANPANGDVLLQICSDSVYVAEHVARRVEHELPDAFRVAWSVLGSQRHTSRSGRTSRGEGRALVGFLDGTSNLDPRRVEEHAKLVFVDPDPAAIATYPPRVPVAQPGQPPPYGQPAAPAFPDDLHEPPHREPAWTKRGSYAVVRASVIATSAWDARALRDQERFVGRWKVSGSALDHADDPLAAPEDPTFADADGSTTPLDAHIRKANPRGGEEDARRRIFRRGYPLMLATPDGIRRGLVFVCFARTITTQFEFIVRGWMTNVNFPRAGAGVDAIRQFESVLCGGYFFVPPLEHAHQPWSWRIPASPVVGSTASLP